MTGEIELYVLTPLRSNLYVSEASDWLFSSPSNHLSKHTPISQMSNILICRIFDTKHEAYEEGDEYRCMMLS